MEVVVIIFIIILVILLPVYVRILSRNAAKGKMDAYEANVKETIKELRDGKKK